MDNETPNVQEALVALFERIARDAGLSPYLAHGVAVDTFDACNTEIMSKAGTARVLAELDRRVALVSV